MPLEIIVPDSSWASQRVELGGFSYVFEWEHNERDGRLRLSIYKDNNPVLVGIKLVENEALLSNYILPDFDHGDLICYRIKNGVDKVGLGNLGNSKQHVLVYLTNAEIDSLTDGA